MENNEKIVGKVLSIIFESSNGNGFKIITFKMKNNIITVKGSLPSVELGDDLQLVGKYVEHKEYGMQFDCISFEKIFPEDESSILEYLESGAIKGVGPKTAQKIVDYFGDDTLKIMYEDPQKLSIISGITKNKAIEIGNEFREKREFYDAVEYLKKYNLQMTEISKIYSVLKGDTIELISNNPYIILKHIATVKFIDIDKIAVANGIDLNSENRIKSAIMYAMTLSIKNGHTYVNKTSLETFVQSITKAESVYITKCMKDLEINHMIEVKEESVALEPLAIAEETIKNVIHSLINDKKGLKITNIDKKIKNLENELGLELTSGQKEAIKEVNKNNITVITGGPGTGKTTITKIITKLYENEEYKIEIAAPTGKAAKRISEVTNHNASTIHRMLEIGKYSDESSFDAVFLETKPIHANLVIIDEASMLDTLMMMYILKSIQKGSKIVLIGDINQLPSVGAGQVLEDIINSEVVKVITLNKIFRQAQKSNIILNAHRVNNGENLQILNDENHLNDMQIINEQNNELMFQKLLEVLNNELKTQDITDFFINSQILTITKKGTSGTLNINEQIQKIYNSKEEFEQNIQNNNSNKKFKSIRYGKVEYRINDRIMQIKNDYDMPWTQDKYIGTGVFNGEMGWIRAINEEEKLISIEFDDGKISTYQRDDLENITHSYAITVHKSQGSEFETIILMLPSNTPILLTRNILYTGISRAKKKLIIIGGNTVITRMINTKDNNTRNTNLKNRLISK